MTDSITTTTDTPAPPAAGPGTGDPARAVVAILGLEFDEDEYALTGGSTVLVTNSDPFVHTFTVDALGIDVDLGPGDEVLVTIPEDPGTYVLYCEPHTSDPDDPSEDDMAARLEVG